MFGVTLIVYLQCILCTTIQLWYVIWHRSYKSYDRGYAKLIVSPKTFTIKEFWRYGKKRLTQLRARRVITYCRIFENRFRDGRVVWTRPAAHDPKIPWVNILQLHVFGRRVCVCGLATVENAERSNLSPSSRVKFVPLSEMTFGRGLFHRKKRE